MTAATVLPYVVILALALAALLVIALGANYELARENREKGITIRQQAHTLASLKRERRQGSVSVRVSGDAAVDALRRVEAQRRADRGGRA